MGPLDLVFHLLNFAAPALFVAAGVSLGARIFLYRSPRALPVWGQFAINLSAGLAASLAGLWFWGQDGRMATYAALVAACATSQWAAGLGWRTRS